MGASTAGVARACEVDPNVLHQWRREFRDGVNTAFSVLGRKVESEEKRLASWRARSGGRRWRSIFEVCHAHSRGVADAASRKSRGAIYEQIVREPEKAKAEKKCDGAGAVRLSGRQSGGLLPVLRSSGSAGRGHCTAGSHPEGGMSHN
jgi:transposase-like protein